MFYELLVSPRHKKCPPPMEPESGVHERLPLDSFTRQMNPIHTLTSYFSKLPE